MSDYDSEDLQEKDSWNMEKESFPDEKPDAPTKPKKKHDQPRLQKLWEKNGPIKLFLNHNTGTYCLYFNNFKHLGFDGLDAQFRLYGRWKLMSELEDNRVRVHYCSEEEIRKCYNALKSDERYNVSVLLDTESYFIEKVNRKNAFPKFYQQPDGLKDGELDEQTKRLLKLEAKIKFDMPPRGKMEEFPVKNIPSPTDSRGSDGEEEEEEEEGTFVGYYKGCRVIEPKKPFVNPYLKPTASYLQWKKTGGWNFSKETSNWNYSPQK